MKKDKKMRAVALIALSFSILGLTLGFAAFSNTLTISSSAQVTPDASDFKLTLYGLPRVYEYDDINQHDPNSMPLSIFTSTTQAAPLLDNNEEATIATLDNDNLSIKNLQASFTKPDQSIYYMIAIKNEGHYDGYLNLQQQFEPASYTCTAKEGTTEALALEACKGIEFRIRLGYIDESGDKIDWDISKTMDETGHVKLEKGKHWYLNIVIAYEYGSARADGPFEIVFEDLKIPMSTAK